MFVVASYKLEDARLSQDLIILLSINNVPASFFLELVEKALEKLRTFFTERGQVFRGIETLPLSSEVSFLSWSLFVARLLCSLVFQCSGVLV